MALRADRSAPNWPLWVLRVSWVAAAVASPGFALDGHSRSLQVVAAAALWAGWAVGVVVLLVPSVVTLVLARILVPIAPVVAVAVLVDNGGDRWTAVALGVGSVATAAVLAGEVGHAYVQASAYGAERRHLLRVPAAVTPLVVLLWATCTAGLLTSTVLLTSSRPVVGSIVGVVTAVLGVLAWRRVRVLADRWLVMVPAGLVLHDPLLLVDTFMATTATVQSVVLAPADTDAADVTGGTTGHAVEVSLTGFETIILAGDRSQPGGRALHVKALLVCPTRPGRAIEDWGSR